MSEFDPYHKWLGIPPRDQPPHHYRLLGIELFESDPDVIDAAAEQRTSFVRQCATGKHLAASQKLLNEIASARLSLLNGAEKRKYDLALRAKLYANAQPPRGVTPSTSSTLPTADQQLPSIDQSKPITSMYVQRQGIAHLKTRSLLIGVVSGIALMVASVAIYVAATGFPKHATTMSNAHQPLHSETSAPQTRNTPSISGSPQVMGTSSADPELTQTNPERASASTSQPAVKLEPLEAATVHEGEVLMLAAKGSATGFDATRLRYFLTDAPPNGCQIDERTGVITWTPTEAQGPGEFRLSVAVSSLDYPLLKDQVTVAVSVLEVNQSPSVDPIADQTIDEGSKLIWTVKARDFDEPAQELTYSLQTNEAVGAAIDGRTGKIEWTPQLSHVGRRFAFHVTVSEVDHPESRQSRDFSINVRRVVHADLILVQNTSGFAWQFRANQKPEELQIQVNEATSTNYRPTCVSGYLVDGQPRFASIWVNDSTPWRLYFGMDRSTRKKLYDTQGTRDRTVWTSFTGEHSHVIVVDTPSQPAWEIRDSFTAASLDYHIKNAASSANQRPVAVWQEAPGRYGVHLVAGLLGSLYWRGFTAQDVARQLKATPAGFRPVYLDGLGLGGSRRYTLVTIADGTSPKWDVQLAIPLRDLERNLEVIRANGMMPLLIDIE